MEQTKEHIDAMSRICAGMTLEEMQNAAFTYKSLVEIVQRRDVRNVCVPDAKDGSELGKYDNYGSGYVDGWNDCREAMISKMGEQK